MTILAIAAFGLTGRAVAMTSAPLPRMVDGEPELSIEYPDASMRAGLDTSGLAPGDSAQRLLDVANHGAAEWHHSELVVSSTIERLAPATATASGALKLSIESCSEPWIRRRTSTPTYACRGRREPAVEVPLDMRGDTLMRLGAIEAASAVHLRATTSLSASAGNEYQGMSMTLDMAARAS